ncbi:vomeronasal type-1 receptor 4-like [Diceros bicornis minor]|uniref:vomeronasal type-1 receptor 4-like n=1 Tax=Diceros bicornis minor TaxID=77932 RepID=UPI0026F14B46|nr:vomeronasal type-1 receptor 4-like [Diceros bicornis minor]
MASGDVATGMIILLQMTVGILGNFCLLHHYLFLYYTGCRWRNTDLIFKHLVVANILVILSKGVPQTLAVLGLKDFLGDIGCKLVFYVHRVSRDVSIGTICLLSVFQVITISPRNSKWAELKVKAPKYLGTSTIFCWVLNMMLNITVPVYITGKWSNKNTTKKHNYGYCYTLHYENITDSLHVALILLHDGFCLGLMIWSSGSMVFILHRHKEQVKYIHTNNLSHRSLPETRATQRILVLLSTFVSLCTLSSIFHICLAVLNNHHLWLVKLSTFIAACFPTISPYIFISHDSRASRLCFA